MSTTSQTRGMSFGFLQVESDKPRPQYKNGYHGHSRSAPANALIATLSVIVAVAIIIGLVLHFIRKRRLRQLRNLRSQRNARADNRTEEGSAEDKQIQFLAYDETVLCPPPPYEAAVTPTRQTDGDTDSLPGYEAALLHANEERSPLETGSAGDAQLLPKENEEQTEEERSY